MPRRRKKQRAHEETAGGHDSFRSVLSQVESMWTPDDWAQFNGPRRLTNPLTLLHEATHWCQHRGLVSHCMTLLTIQALKNKDDARLPNAELDKVLALRALLAPFGEGASHCTRNTITFRPTSLAASARTSDFHFSNLICRNLDLGLRPRLACAVLARVFAGCRPQFSHGRF